MPARVEGKSGFWYSEGSKSMAVRTSFSCFGKNWYAQVIKFKVGTLRYSFSAGKS